jgi:hypothetical protein
MQQEYRMLSHLLRLAVGTAESEKVASKGVAWAEVYNMARKQGVLAVAFDGLTKLFAQDKEFAKSFPLSLKMQWINATCGI